MAKEADWGICLARTDPDAPKHDGISCFMRRHEARPGIDIRPLRELTGMAMFNEVFFDDVFVPDDCLVGAVDDGWRAGAHDARQRARLDGQRHRRSAAASRRCSASWPSAGRRRPAALRRRARRAGRRGARARRARLRTDAARARAAPTPGSEASVRKLLGVEHDQHVQEVGLALLGARGAAADDGAAAVVGRRSSSTAASRSPAAPARSSAT